MLLSLSIKNYALINELEIHFSDGFTTITGETGAGKSVLLGALSLLLGNRADMQVLMERQRKCVVEGMFNIQNLDIRQLFTDNDLDYDQTVFLRREIIPSGRSRAFINDSPVKLDLLKKLGDRLVDIHSQHQTLLLGNVFFQLQVLDDFIGDRSIFLEYREAFLKYRTAKERLRKLEDEFEQARKDEDYFRFQLSELEEARLDSEDADELAARERFLSHAEEVRQKLNRVDEILVQQEHSILDEMDEATASLQKVVDYLPGLKNLLERLESTSIELRDIAADISRMGHETDFNPGEIVQIRERLDHLYRLQQKHQAGSVKDLIKIRNEIKTRLDNLTTEEGEIDQLKKHLEKLMVVLEEKAEILSLRRKAKAPDFAEAVTGNLRSLGMKDASFEVKIAGTPEYTERGKDQVEFLFSANKGARAGEIGSIASGGELSRLMLSIKSLITREQLLPTVIFDEIDAGVSGDIAGKVGKLLKQMSKHHQLIVITHLPQIAAKADHHFNVFKETVEDQAYTHIQQLESEERVDEIAKLLSDEEISVAARDTARELLRHP